MTTLRGCPFPEDLYYSLSDKDWGLMRHCNLNVAA